MPSEYFEAEDEEQGAARFVRLAVGVLGVLIVAGLMFARKQETPPLTPPPTPQILAERQVTPPQIDAPAPAPPAFVRPEPVGDLVAHWPLDEDGHERIAGTPWREVGRPQRVEAAIGRGLYFGPGAAYVIEAENAAQMRPPFTITTWVRLPWRRQVDDWLPLITGEPGWRLHTDPVKRVPVLQLDESGAGQLVRGSRPLFDGRWHHLAAVADGGELRIYLDGKLDGRVTRDVPAALRPSAHDLVIGGHSGKAQRALHGALDELRLYRVALAENAIAALAADHADFAPGPWQNLIPQIRPDAHTLSGRWRKVDGELEQFGDVHVNRFLRLPDVIEQSYELDLEFTRINGGDGVNVLLPVGGRGVHLMLGSHVPHGGLAGLEVVAGQAMLNPDNPTRKNNFLLQDGRCYALNIRVITLHERARIDIELDGAPFIQWEGPVSALVATGFPETEYPSQGILAIGCSRAVTRFHQLRLRMLD
jgi:hypothetical protein